MTAASAAVAAASAAAVAIGAGRNRIACRYRSGKRRVCLGEIRGLDSEGRLGPRKYRLSSLKGCLGRFDGITQRNLLQQRVLQDFEGVGVGILCYDQGGISDLVSLNGGSVDEGCFLSSVNRGCIGGGGVGRWIALEG